MGQRQWFEVTFFQKKKKQNKIKAIGSSVQQSKRARQPAIKPLWPADSVGEKQKMPVLRT